MRVLLLCSVLLLPSCRFIMGSVFYESSASYMQTISLQGISTVTIHCYCPEYTVQRDPYIEDLQLEISGQFSIAGYHGSWEDAGATPLAPESIAFRVESAHSALELHSQEYTYIHHAEIIDRLQIRVPVGGVQVIVAQMQRSELEGRGQ